MSVIEDKVDHGFVRLTVDGELVLGVRVSGHKRNMAGQLQSLRRGKGWIIRGDRINEWVILGLIEHEGGIYAYGPYGDNTPITEFFSMDTAEAFDRVGELVSALQTLMQAAKDPPRFVPEFIVRFSDGGLLFLPAEIIDGILGVQTEKERVAAYDPFNHPDLSGEKNACFLVGVLVYRILTGKLPYAADTSEELHERIRQARVLPARLAVPDLRTELSDLLARSFDPSTIITLDDWREEIGRCRNEGFTRDITPEERSRLAEAAERFRKNADTGFKRRVFFRKNWRTMLVVAGIVVIVGAVGGSILKNVLRPRITVGMNPAQVVRLFYTSINSFNSQAMQDCVIDGAGKEAISEAINLFVISRVRKGYEGTSGYIDAQTWIDEGKPKLKPSISVYGVADLKLEANSRSVFTVTYQKWEPAQLQNQAAPSSSGPVLMAVQGWRHQDRVYLKNEGKFWAIYRIDRVKSEKLGGPITVTNPAEPSGFNAERNLQ